LILFFIKYEQIFRAPFPSLSGTFGIHTRLVLNPKMPKEPSSPSRSNAVTADPDKTKNMCKIET